MLTHEHDDSYIDRIPPQEGEKYTHKHYPGVWVVAVVAGYTVFMNNGEEEELAWLDEFEAGKWERA